MTWHHDIPGDRAGQSELVARMLHELTCIGIIIERLGEHIDGVDGEVVRWLGQRVRDCAGEANEARKSWLRPAVAALCHPAIKVVNPTIFAGVGA